MKSDKIKKGVERAGARSLLYATGISKDDMAKPFIAVATSRTDIIPGHIHMGRLERFIAVSYTHLTLPTKRIV